MAIGDKDICSVHSDTKVALFCQTCEDLICTKCISKAPNSPSLHRDHLYMDISEAYQILKEDIEKLIAKVRDCLNESRSKRKEKQHRLQNMQLELLRKKTFVERRRRSLVDRVNKDENSYVHTLEKLMTPAMTKEETILREVDYDVVSREGLVGTLESLNRMSKWEVNSFIKGMVHVKKEMSEMDQRDKELDECTCPDVEQEKGHIRRVNLNLVAEKRAIGRAFTFPDEAPPMPRILPSWCVTGVTSVCLVWKQPQGAKVDTYRLEYKPMCTCSHNFLKQLKQDSLNPKKSGKKATKRFRNGYASITVRHTPGRCHAILRNLKANVEYEVQVYACNAVGESHPAVLYVHTLDAPEGNRNIWTKHRRKKSLPSLSTVASNLLALMACGIYIFLVLYLIGMSFETKLCDSLLLNISNGNTVDICRHHPSLKTFFDNCQRQYQGFMPSTSEIVDDEEPSGNYLISLWRSAASIGDILTPHIFGQ